jgi:hypothetical protein
MNPKPWYKSPVAYIAGVVIFVGFVASLAGSSSTPQTSNTAAGTSAVQTVQTQQLAQAATSVQLSNNNTYTNVDGNTVHSPAYTSDGSVPEGATAECRDGTYSFSQHHSGTCSGHGGVSRWL